MIGCDRVNSSRGEPLDKSVDVFLGAQRGIHLQIGIVRDGLRMGEQQMMRSHFAGDGDFLFLCAPDYLQRLTRGKMRDMEDRKSTRLNSSHTVISYAVFCLKKKKITK